jgi:hypothetical protein
MRIMRSGCGRRMRQGRRVRARTHNRVRGRGCSGARIEQMRTDLSSGWGYRRESAEGMHGIGTKAGLAWKRKRM